MQEEKYSLFVPIEKIEKAKDAKGNEILKIGGVASNMNVGADVDGEVLDVNGFELDQFLKSGFINYHHLAGKDPSAIIGEPTNAYVKDGKMHIEGVLYADSEMAQKVYSLAKALENSPSGRRLGYSIEGKALRRDPQNKKFISKARITGCAVTPMPKNGGTELTIIKGGLDSVEFSDELIKGGDDFIIDVVDDNGVRWTVDKNLNIEKSEDNDSIEKGFLGIGSRGGKVIGHTKSGKPIYESGKHSHLDTEDHYDAAEHHEEAMKNAKDDKTKSYHKERKEFHESEHKKGYEAYQKKRSAREAEQEKEYNQKHGIKKAEGVQVGASAAAGEGVTQVEHVEGGGDPRKKKKKKSLENLFEGKEKISKGEIYKELFSSFNLSVDLAKGFYNYVEKVQQILTPNMEIKDITPEAINKAMQVLNLIQKGEEPDPATGENKTEETSTDSADDLSKAIDADKIKAEYAECMKKAEELKAQAKDANISLESNEKLGKPQGGDVQTLSVNKGEEDELRKAITGELMVAFDEKFNALGTLLMKGKEENTDLKKAVAELSEFNTRLAEKLQMIERQPNERKSLSGVKYVDRFEKGSQEQPGLKVVNLSDPRERQILIKAMEPLAFTKEGIKDDGYARAIEYLSYTGNLGGVEVESQRVAKRIESDLRIKVVRA